MREICLSGLTRGSRESLLSTLLDEMIFLGLWEQKDFFLLPKVRIKTPFWRRERIYYY